MKKNIALFVIAIVALVAAYIYTAFQGRFGIFIPLTILFPIIILLFVFSIIRKNQKEKGKLLKTGMPAKAKILGVSDTGVRINGQPRLSLQLEVTSENGQVFNAQVHALFSILQPIVYKPGMILNVRYDPNNLNSIAIESSNENIPIQNNVEMKPLICPSCGGQIAINGNQYNEKVIICKYCGTVIDLHE